MIWDAMTLMGRHCNDDFTGRQKTHLLTWNNFNPNMEISYPFLNVNVSTVWVLFFN